MAQIIESVIFQKKEKAKKEKMIKSISFKDSEKELWDHLNSQLNAAYYLKYLILKDMQEIENDEIQISDKNKSQNNANSANSNDNDYLNLDF